MGSTTTEGEAAKVAKKATGATMLSPDIGDLHVPIVLPTPATEIPSVEMVEVISSGDEEQWTGPINTSPTPEGMSWADMLISQEEERDLLDVDTHFASCKALQPVAVIDDLTPSEAEIQLKSTKTMWIQHLGSVQPVGLNYILVD
ncbi:hypothetical protein EMCRGX_G003776 [Ephydatia muelleri]